MNIIKRLVNFTLIELLVVVAILSILMTILLPALKKAKATGKRATCLSNQKQIGSALAMYINDFDGWIPPYFNDNNPNGVQEWWRDENLGRYLGTEKNWYKSSIGNDRLDLRFTAVYCSADPSKWLECVSVAPDPWRYYWNSSYCYAYNFPSIRQPMLSARVRSPSKKILLADGMHPEHLRGDHLYNNGAPSYYVTSNNAIPCSYHLNSANYMFVDGHAESIPQFGGGNEEMRDAVSNFDN